MSKSPVLLQRTIYTYLPQLCVNTLHDQIIAITDL